MEWQGCMDGAMEWLSIPAMGDVNMGGLCGFGFSDTSSVLVL